MDNLDDSCPVGTLHLRIYRRGEIVDAWEEANLVLNNRRKINARLLGGDANYAVTHIGLGEGTAPPAAGNTSLTNAFTKAVDAVSYPAARKVKFDFSVGLLDAVGLAISEFGLLTSGGVLYARKVRGAPLVKTSDMSLVGTWTITY